MSADRGSLPDQRVCADCGATDDLYFNDIDGEWVCDEVADCRETQWDADRAERDRLRSENETLKERYAAVRHAYGVEAQGRGRLEAEVERVAQIGLNVAASLRAEVETLKEEQVAFVRALEKAQAENETLKARYCQNCEDDLIDRPDLRAENERLKAERDDKLRRLEPDGCGGFRWEAADIEAERDHYRADLVRAVQKQEELRSIVRRMARFALDAHDLLTPGMKAGVGEARQALQACAELAGTSDEDGA